MEIKFRVWDVKNKKMIKSPCDSDFDIAIFLPNLVQVYKKNKQQEFLFGNYLNKNFIFMLYIGAKDINGEEIYVGDIVKQTVSGEIDVVSYDYDFLGFRPFFSVYEGYKVYEIIGNIYENPELLKILNGGKDD